VPIVKISLLDSWSRDDEALLSQTIHGVLVDVLRIPEDDYNHRILRFDRDTWHLPPGKSDQYLLIEIDLFPGRRKETKSKLFRSLVARFEELGVPSTDVIAIIREPSLDNWGIRGGIAAGQAKLGYELDV